MQGCKMAAFEDRSTPDLDQFKGGKWTDWLSAIQLTSESNHQTVPDHASKRDVEVARLRRPDTMLFGYRPANDKFYLVVCERCGHLVKPQSINAHYERRHKSKRISELPSLSSMRVADGKRKHPVDKSISRKLSPLHSSGRTVTHEKGPSRSGLPPSMSEHSVDNSKSGPKPGKVFAAAERAKTHPDGSSLKNHRFEKSAAKPRNSSSAHGVVARTNRTSSKKYLQKSGDATLLDSVSKKSGATKPTSHCSTDIIVGQQHQRDDRTNDTKNKSRRIDSAVVTDFKKHEKTDSGISHKKRRKNHDGYHHHYHESARRNSVSDSDSSSTDYSKLINTAPRLGKSETPLDSVKSDKSHKRRRPISRDSEFSTSPQRHKVPALDRLLRDEGLPAPKASDNVPNSAVPAKFAANVPNSAASTKSRKEKKILPLKAREYDPNRHCGVFVKEEISHCRRSLTCKVHPLSAKRAVTGRRKQFDELVQEHSREKQRMKEKAAASAAPMLPPTGQSIRSPPVPSSLEFALPSPVPTTSTQLSSPTNVTAILPLTPQSLTSPGMPKAKPSISLFPRIFAAWHVDCWENNEFTEDASAKSRYSCYYLQRHPTPIAIFNFQARRSSSCQAFHDAKLEPRLEGISSSFLKLGSKQTQKPRKQFSFTPIPQATHRPARYGAVSQPVHLSRKTSESKVPKRCGQQHGGGPSNDSRFAPSRNALTVSHTANNFQIIQPKTVQTNKKSVNGKFLNLVSPNGQVQRPSASNASVNELPSTSIFTVNDVTRAATPLSLQTSLGGNAGQVSSNSNVITLFPARQSGGDSRTAVHQETKSAIPKYYSMQSHPTNATPSERIDGKPLMVQLPNGIHSSTRNVLLRQGTQSVTLSGSIGALTGTDRTFSGNQIYKALKSNNVKDEGKTKHLSAKQSASLPQLNQPAGSSLFKNILQNENKLSTSLPRGNTVNHLNHQYVVQSSNFPEAVTLKTSQSRGDSGGTTATGDTFSLFCSPVEDPHSLTTSHEKHDTQMANLNRIDVGASLWGIQQADDT